MKGTTMQTLTCPQCGAPLDVPSDKYKELSTGGFFYWGEIVIKCDHCNASISPFSEILPQAAVAIVTNSPSGKALAVTQTFGDVGEGAQVIGVVLPKGFFG